MQTIVFTSEEMLISKTRWRFIIKRNDAFNNNEAYYTTGFQWYRPECECFRAEWGSETSWPRYNVNDGQHGGLPKTLKKLWEREKHAMDKYNFS